MPQYLYSDAAEPFAHRIRCVPTETIDHEDGVAWLQGIYETLAMLGYDPEVDYVTENLTTICFADHDRAERFYNMMLINVGEMLALREF